MFPLPCRRLLGSFNPFSDDPLPAYPKKQLVLKIISGQQLPKPPDSMLGDRGEVQTHTTRRQEPAHVLVSLTSLDMRRSILLTQKWRSPSRPSDHWPVCRGGDHRFAHRLLQGADASCGWQRLVKRWLKHFDAKIIAILLKKWLQTCMLI